MIRITDNMRWASSVLGHTDDNWFDVEVRRPGCPPRLHLTFFRLGELDEIEAAAVKAHVESCEECARFLDYLDRRQRQLLADPPRLDPQAINAEVERRIQERKKRRLKKVLRTLH